MTAATRNEKHIRSALPVLYLALELGVAKWKLAFITDLEAKPRVRIMPARDLKRLVKEVATAMRWFGLPDSTRVRSCYEAGRDGFWLHRHLATVWIDNRVVDSASIEVNRRQRRAKSDGLDARKLVTMAGTPVPCGRVAGMERGADPHGRAGRSATAASRIANVETGPGPREESDPRVIGNPGGTAVQSPGRGRLG